MVVFIKEVKKIKRKIKETTKNFFISKNKKHKDDVVLEQKTVDENIFYTSSDIDRKSKIIMEKKKRRKLEKAKFFKKVILISSFAVLLGVISVAIVVPSRVNSVAKPIVNKKV